MLKVQGDENKTIYSGELEEGVYQPEGGGIQELPISADAVATAPAANFEEQMEFGKNAYMQTCFACHQAEGQGIANAFPPLAKSDYLNADVNRTIDIILRGKTGEITVNGEIYNSLMTAQTLSDDEVANVLTYVYNSWGNSKKEVTPAMVKSRRNAH